MLSYSFALFPCHFYPFICRNWTTSLQTDAETETEITINIMAEIETETDGENIKIEAEIGIILGIEIGRIDRGVGN